MTAERARLREILDLTRYRDLFDGEKTILADAVPGLLDALDAAERDLTASRLQTRIERDQKQAARDALTRADALAAAVEAWNPHTPLPSLDAMQRAAKAYRAARNAP